MGEKTKEQIVVMNFSGIYEMQSFYQGYPVCWTEVRNIAGSNCYCDEYARRQIKNELRGLSAGGIHFIDSGNYHYMSRIWFEKIQEPFRLLVFDHHTDMQPPAFGGLLSCGGWVAAAMAEVPHLREVFLAGPKEEDIERDTRGKGLDVRYLGNNEMKRHTMEENLQFFRDIPADLPLYISVDKDVLCPADASTAWSQGNMRLGELLAYLQEVQSSFDSAGQKLIGMDVCGESAGDGEGNTLNERANGALLHWYLHDETRACI